MSLRRSIVLGFLTCVGCGGDPHVQLTIAPAPALVSKVQRDATSLDVTLSGADDGHQAFNTRADGSHLFSDGEERVSFVPRPGVQGNLHVDVIVRNQADVTIATGHAEGPLLAGGGVDLYVMLGSPGVGGTNPPDGGEPGASDLGTGLDADAAIACEPGTHVAAAGCEADVRACTLANGTGTQAWTGVQFGACVATSCATDYVIANGACVRRPVIEFAETAFGPNKSTFVAGRPVYGRILNLQANNAQGCMETVGKNDGACSTGPFTQLPNAQWAFFAASSVWVGTFPDNALAEGQYRMFARNSENGVAAQTVLITLTPPPCQWSTFTAGPVNPTKPSVICSSAQKGTTASSDGYTWTCICQ